MAQKKKMAPIGRNPIDATTTYGIQSKAVFKDTHFVPQMKKVFAALYSQPKTMLMVSIETGIMRANICRYVALWRKRKCIKVVRKGICPISKRGGVQYLTTGPAIVSPSKQDSHE